MARDLTKHIADHDNPNSRQHEIDKAQKKVRQETHYEQAPAIEVKAGGGILDGIFKSPTKGFCFRVTKGEARRAKDDAAYTKEIIKASKARCRYKRLRVRDGKTRKDYGHYQHGAVSLITTAPPWAVPTLARIGKSELEDLMLHLAGQVSREVEEASGRESGGGGVHLDTEVPHLHHHIFKISKDGEAYPKSSFLTAGPWTCGAARINDKFPGLLSENKVKLLEANLARKRVENLIDLRCAKRVDRELEKWIKERGGLWEQYQKDCESYRKAKTRAQKEEGKKRLMQASLSHFAKTEVWPLAAHMMTAGMMRMVPKEIRPAVFLAIRAQQIIRRPVSTLVRIGISEMLKLGKEPAPLSQSGH